MGSLVLGCGNNADDEVGADLSIRRKILGGWERTAAEGGLVVFDRCLFGNCCRLSIAVGWRWQVSRGHDGG